MPKFQDPRLAYESNQVYAWNPGQDLYYSNLPPVDVVAKDTRVADAVRQGQNRFLRGAAELPSQGQRHIMGMITGTQQQPSQAWGFKNPQSLLQKGANLGIDVALDPLLYATLGTGIGFQTARNSVGAIPKASVGSLSKQAALPQAKRTVYSLSDNINPSYVADKNVAFKVSSGRASLENKAREQFLGETMLNTHAGGGAQMTAKFGPKSGMSRPGEVFARGQANDPLFPAMIREELKSIPKDLIDVPLFKQNYPKNMFLREIFESTPEKIIFRKGGIVPKATFKK